MVGTGNARRVDQNGNRAEALFGLLAGCRDCLGVGDIHDRHIGARTEFRLCSRQPFAANVPKTDPCAGGQNTPGKGKPQPLCAAGDDRNLAFKIQLVDCSILPDRCPAGRAQLIPRNGISGIALAYYTSIMQAS